MEMQYPETEMQLKKNPGTFIRQVWETSGKYIYIYIYSLHCFSNHNTWTDVHIHLNNVEFPDIPLSSHPLYAIVVPLIKNTELTRPWEGSPAAWKTALPPSCSVASWKGLWPEPDAGVPDTPCPQFACILVYRKLLDSKFFASRLPNFYSRLCNNNSANNSLIL